MIIGHITTPQIEELERIGQAVITEKPAEEGAVSFRLVFESEVFELRQALMEQHNRMAAEITALNSTIDALRLMGTIMAREPYVAATTLARAHFPAVDLDALCLTLLTDDQAVATWERVKESRRLSYVADIYARVPE